MEAELRGVRFAVDPLIAEAKRRMRRRRVLGICAVMAVAASAGLTLELRSPANPAINPTTGLGALVGTWSHHGAELIIRPNGWGLAKFRTYRETAPGMAEITFRVTGVTRAGRTVDARIRVLHGSAESHARAGMRGTARLWRGVIYWSVWKTGRPWTFCSIKPGARWICGL